jgi:hypothetical protein
VLKSNFDSRLSIAQCFVGGFRQLENNFNLISTRKAKLVKFFNWFWQESRKQTMKTKYFKHHAREYQSYTSWEYCDFDHWDKFCVHSYALTHTRLWLSWDEMAPYRPRINIIHCLKLKSYKTNVIVRLHSTNCACCRNGHKMSRSYYFWRRMPESQNFQNILKPGVLTKNC